MLTTLRTWSGGRAGRFDRLAATHAVPDQMKPRVPSDRITDDDVVDVRVPRVRAGPVGFAVTARVERGDAVARGEQRRERGEAARVVPEAVAEQDRRRRRIAPFDDVDAHAERIDEALALRLHGTGIGRQRACRSPYPGAARRGKVGPRPCTVGPNSPSTLL